MKKTLLLITFILSTLIGFAQHPINLTSSNITSSSSELSWTDNGCSTSYKLRYREQGGSWIPSNSGQTNVTSPTTIDTLNPNTIYEWSVKCSGTSGWSANEIFTTNIGCSIISTSSIINSSCTGLMNGEIDLTVSNGSTPYTYLWSNGTITEDLIGVSDGDYIVTITDNSGCILIDTITVGIDGGVSISQSITGFNPNPLTSYQSWSYDTLNITNTGCSVRLRPDFVISCNSGSIQQGDFVLRYNSFGANWPIIPYSINANGDAYGFWNLTTNDSTGTNIAYGQIQDIIIRVKFVNPAILGTYTATWTTNEVDNLGNVISQLDVPTISSLYLVNCSTFSIDSTTTTSTTCLGGSDGTANINTILNGSGQYSYSWNNGTTSQNITNVSAGTYTCIVTDNNWGCTDSVTITVPSADSLQSFLTGTQISCNGLSDGTLTGSASGGSGNYKFIWSPSLPFIPTHTALAANTYTLTIDDLGCPGSYSSVSYMINEPDPLQESTIYSDNSSCDSTNCNGSINISISGGTTPYSIIWNNGDSAVNKSNLCADTYIITITGDNNCSTFTETITISDSASTPNIAISYTNIVCNGDANGSAEVQIVSGSGGTGNIASNNYCASTVGESFYTNIELVKLAGDNSTINNSTAGICDTYDDFTSLSSDLTPGQNYTVHYNINDCNNIGATAGTKIFIDWNIDGDFDDAGEEIGSTSLTAAPYSDSITFIVPNIGFFGATKMRVVSQYNDDDFGACEVGTYAPTYIQPWFGATEDYTVIINGTVPATYLWNTGSTNNSISNLSGGNYYCTVTDTNNCTVSDTITITEPSVISPTESITNVNCNGGNDATVTLSISGGTAGYITDWGINNPTALSVGTYNYTITDTNACNYTDSVIITEPDVLSISSSITDILCYGDSTGNINITISGGTINYTYSWSNGSTNEDLTNAIAGTYYLSVTDLNSCVLLDTFIISEPSIISVNSTTTDASCFSYSDGNVTLSISGGTSGYSTDWGTNNPTALSAGTYNYIITDTNACTFINSVTINQPNTITTIATTTNVSCNGSSDGTASISISGGTAGYITDWGTNNPTALSVGTYNYTITDTNACNYTDSVIITEPLVLSATYTQTNVTCNGLADGSAFVNIAGGTTDYILSWDTLTYPLPFGLSVFNTPVGVPTGTYPFGVTDVNGCYFTDTITIIEPNPISVSELITNVSCNGGNDATVTLSISGGTLGYTTDWGTNNPQALSTGTYNYTITDTNSCTYNNSVTVTEPLTLTSSISATDLSTCLISNGAINLSVNGGISPYSYLWNNSDTTEDLTNLSAGNYSVIISDMNGCSDSNNILVNQPSNGLSISLNANTINGYEISCYGGNNGNIITNTSGGVGNLTFVWNSGDTTQNISNLTAGNYSVTITDSVGCSLSDNITLTEPYAISSVYSTTPVLCNGDSTGSAIVNFSGGVTNYILNWSGFTYPLPNGLTTFITPVGVPSGTYPYSIIDANGCMLYDTITITEPNQISSTYTSSNYNGFEVSCNGGTDASINFSWNGGVTPYSNWFNNISTTDSIQNNLTANTYTDSIIDANGCTFSQSITLTEPTALSLSLNSTDNSCYNSCDGTISSQISGGVTTYSYQWNNGANTDSIFNLCAGNYNVVLTDANGCTILDSTTISEPNQITITTDSITEVSVYDGNDGEIYISTNGGFGNYLYIWNGPTGYNSTSEDINNLYFGNYLITVTDSTNCSNSDSIFVNQPPSLSISIDTIINLSCYEECNGQINITADGGDSTYSYIWIGPNGFTSTEEDIDSLCAGTYELIVSDTTSSINTTITILQPTQLQIITITDTALCFGGAASATAYTYGGQYPYITNWDNGSNSITTYLNAGMHYVNIMDNNGCSVSDSVFIIENDSISVTTSSTNISCYGLTDGSVQVNIISGGVSPYTYSDNNGINFQNSNIFTNLSVGTYNYILMDNNGCITSTTESINEPLELSFTISATSVSCNGECDATAITNITGGTTPYYADWGGLDENALCAGLTTVIVEDSNSCLAINSVIINEPNPVIVVITANGMTLNATSGFLSYQWIDENGDNILGATYETYTPTTAGQYAVNVTTNNGCLGTSIYIQFIIESVGDINSILSVYPNPTNSWITIETKEIVENNIKIYNTFGEIVNIIPSENFNDYSERVDLSSLSKGIYIIQLINNNTIINYRIILQ